MVVIVVIVIERMTEDESAHASIDHAWPFGLLPGEKCERDSIILSGAGREHSIIAPTSSS